MVENRVIRKYRNHLLTLLELGLRGHAEFDVISNYEVDRFRVIVTDPETGELIKFRVQITRER